MKRLHFSTSAAPPGCRREMIAAAYAAHVNGAIDFPDEGPVRTDMWMRQLNDVHLALVDTSPVRFSTPPAADDAFYIGVAVSGGGVIDAAGEPRAVAAGDVNLMTRDRNCLTVVNQPSRILSIMAPRERFDIRFDGPPRIVNHAAARLLQSYAMAVLREESALSEADQSILSRHIADLAALALGGVRAARRQAIKADIAAHLCDPELSLDWLTRRHRLSASYIRALFYDEETSVSDFIADARLDYASRLLRDPAQSGRTIAATAFMAGFGDVSWFNKIFRRRFGVTPSQWRAGRN